MVAIIESYNENLRNYGLLFLFYLNVRLLSQTFLLAKIDQIMSIQTRNSFITNTD